MKKKIYKLTEQDLHKIIKKTLKEELEDNDENIVSDGENDTFGGNPTVDAAIEILEFWDWQVDQVSGNLIYAHLIEDENLQIVVDATKWFNVIITEIHFKDDEYGINTSYLRNIDTLVDKLADING